MPRITLILKFLVVLGMLSSVCSAATVETESASSVETDLSPQRTTVRIVIVCDAFEGMDTPSIERTIRSQSADLEVEIAFHQVADVPATSVAQDELGTSLIEQTGATAAFIIYSNSDLVEVNILLDTAHGIEKSYRSVNVSAGTPLREALGVIVRASITTIINRTRQFAQGAAAKNKANVSKAAEQPPNEPTAEENKPDDSKVSTALRSALAFFSLGAAGGFFSGAASPWAGMDASLGVNVGRYWGIAAGYIAFSKVTADSSNVELTIYRHPIRFEVRFTAPVRKLFIGGGLAAVLNVTHEQVDTPSTGWTVAADDTEVGAALAVFSEISGLIRGSLYFFGRLAADIPMYSPEYRVASSQSDFIILKPLGIQPNITIGLKMFFF